MSTTSGAGATNLKSVAGAHHPGHPARAAAVGEGDSLAGGFLALLQSLEPQVDAEGQDTGAQSESTALVAPTAPQALAPGQLSSLPDVASSPSPVAMTQNPQPELAMLLAQYGAGAMEQIGMVPASPRPDSGAGLGASVISVPVAMTQNRRPDPAQPLAQSALAMGAEGSDADGGGEAGQVPGLVSQMELPDSALPDAPPAKPPLYTAQNLRREAAPSESLGQMMEAFTSSRTQDAEARLTEVFQGQSELPMPARPSRGKALEPPARSGVSLLESRFSFSMASSLRESAMLGVQLNSGTGEALARPLERHLAPSSTVSGAVDGFWGQQTGLAGAWLDLPAPNADPATTALESMVADTVSYWVTQGIQNAELKLDGLGVDSLDVSIALRGDEARIDFRTDQPDIRQVLEGAATHLKELLAKEGLLLSGMSVGSSAQQGAGGQDQRQRQGARQANIARLEAAPSESAPRQLQSLARALDIFV